MHTPMHVHRCIELPIAIPVVSATFLAEGVAPKSIGK